ncbi:lantibiotic dehydratase [Jiulongibacter sp. NS-SX5]|uniref:lantibiotic dehydratase n=1 Tax=Jiulongibacter sp. NS-SX5 TaxID=3463854 RepID=UPI0040594764
MKSENRNNYTFYSSLVLRTPSWPVLDKVSEKEIQEFIANPHFLEALLIASPVLHDAVMKSLAEEADLSQDVTLSLAKYILRASNRCTPFGLFSGISLVKWTEDDGLKVKTKARRKTKFDMNFLSALKRQIEHTLEIREKLIFYPNTSLYEANGQFRFVEYQMEGGKRTYQLTAILQNAVLEKLLGIKNEGLTINEYVSLVVEEGFTEEESRGFIESLIENQILVNELEPTITGEGYFQHILEVTKGERPEQFFQLLNGFLDGLDQEGSNYREDIDRIHEHLEPLKLEYNKGALLQVTSLNKVVAGGISKESRQNLIETVELLRKCKLACVGNHKIEQFKDKFYQRYEEAKVPLLEVLDDEVGIGYGGGSSLIIPLLEGVQIPYHHLSQNISVDRQLFQRLLNHRSYSLELNSLIDQDLKGPPLADSFSLVFRHLVDNQLLFDYAGGTSALALSARFADADPELFDTLRLLAEDEQSKRPQQLVEVVHFPQEKTGNIVARPGLRSYEIPYLAHSGVSSKQQILARNLIIQLVKGQFVLTDSASGKELLPRMANAHNYAMDALPLYEFLGDLQSQNQLKGVQFEWPSWTNELEFLPRIQHKNVIVQRARWNLKKSKLKELLACKTEESLVQWRINTNLPESVVLKSGDNELRISFDSYLSLNLLKKEAKGKESLTVLEDIKTSDKIRDHEGKILANQLVALVKNDVPVRNLSFEGMDDSDKVERIFYPGSEWLYLKIYASEKALDKLLFQTIYPYLQSLAEQQQIRMWFFVRFADPEPHLRIRLHLGSKDDFILVLQGLQYLLQPFLTNRLIFKTQLETYHREMERYGPQNIHLAEAIHSLDAYFISYVLSQYEEGIQEDIRWKLGLKLIDVYMNAIGLDLEEKYNLAEQKRSDFYTEFEITQIEKKSFDHKFREHRSELEEVMSSGFIEEFSDFEPMLQNLTRNLQFTSKNSRSQLADTFIHMSINRVSLTKPREHELTLYDFLSRVYKSQIARRRKK